MAVKAFKVLTEFTFDVSHAVTGAKLMNDQVQKLSDISEQAIQNVQNLGMSFVLSFSGAGGGILGLLGNAVSSSMKFKNTQIEIANAMVQNGAMMNGQFITLNQAMTKSEEILESVIGKARKFSIDPDALAGQVKFFNNILSAKKMAGPDLSNATELARVSLKAAPALGVSSQQSTQGILAGLTGQLSKNTQFGTRLFMEAGDAIKKATGGAVTDLKSFNKALPNVRLKALIKGLDKLAGSSNIVKLRALSLENQLLKFKKMFFSIGSLFRKIGDTFAEPLRKVLIFVNKYLETKGARLLKLVARFIKPILEDPIELYMKMKQMAALGGQIGKVLAVSGILIGISHLGLILTELSAMPIIGGVARFAQSMLLAAGRIPILGKLGKWIVSFSNALFSVKGMGIFRALITTFGRLFGWVFVILIPLQGLLRSLEKAKLANMLRFAELLPEIMESFQRVKDALSDIFSPIQEMIRGWEDIFDLMVGGTSAVDGLNSGLSTLATVLEGLGTVVNTLWSFVKGVVASMSAVYAQILENPLNFIRSGALLDTALEFGAAEFNKGMNRSRTPTLDKNGNPTTTGDSPVVNQHINMKNNFKEVLQPDRIAFTIKDQLQKSARNATQTTSGSGNVFGTRKMAGFQRKSF